MSADELKNLLNPSNDGDLGRIVRRAREMGELTDVLARALPADDAAGVAAANLRDDGELVIIATTPAWAARLRYETDALLEAARSVGLNAHTCRVRVSQG